MKTNDPYSQRLKKIQQQLSPNQVWLVATPAHITYLTNFHFLVPEEKEAFLIISAKKTWLIHASFCPTGEVTSAVTKLVQTQGDALHRHFSAITQEQPELVIWYVDENILSVAEYKILQSFSQLKLLTLDHQLIWNLRMVKDQTEQNLCLRAGQIAQQAFQQLIPMIKIGMSEVQIRNLLDNLVIDLGADKTAFPTIVGFNQHSALPHHQPDSSLLTPNSVVLIDFGATFQGYRSDMTRTFWFGDQPSKEFLNQEKTVKFAYQQAWQKLNKRNTKTKQPNIKASDLDMAAREVIKEAGFGPQFIHTTGHGVGLDIHEPPSIYWKNDILLKPGMVITIEPGIYLTGQFGYRYENTILVTSNGALELTT